MFLTGLSAGLKSIWQSEVFSNILHTLKGSHKHHCDGGNIKGLVSIENNYTQMQKPHNIQYLQFSRSKQTTNLLSV